MIYFHFKLWSLLEYKNRFALILIQFLFFLVTLSVIKAQEAQPPTSCLGLANPKTQAEQDEFKSCILQLSKEWDDQRKSQLLKRKIESSEQLVNQVQGGSNRMTTPRAESRPYLGSLLLTEQIQRESNNLNTKDLVPK